jgi:predicted DNA binding CopG/RHH family protein
MKKPLKLPSFKNEDEERDFWSKIDLSDYFEAKDFEAVSFPNLKPSTKTISLRLPEDLLAKIKSLANKHDVPYQSMIKMFLAQRIDHESRRHPTK